MTSDREDWFWTEDPENIGPESLAFFEEFWGMARKDPDGFYSEQLLIDDDGRLNLKLRLDGIPPLLPSFFYQLKARTDPEGPPVARGPTLEEFSKVLGRLQQLIPTFEFVVQHDPHGRWVRYRVRR